MLTCERLAMFAVANLGSGLTQSIQKGAGLPTADFVTGYVTKV
jgi:hypothetical protein